MKILKGTFWVAAGFFALSTQVWAQEWPSRPIELVSPGAAGGSSDTVWRTIHDSVVQTLGQQITVNYMPGAAGNIAGAYTSNRPADGYTFLVSTIASHGIGPSLYKNLEYDPIEDLRGVARLVTLPNVLYTNANLPVESVADLVAYAKANPGAINYASTGLGTSTHLSAVLFSQLAGIEMNHVPYAASAPAVQGMLTGEVDVSFENLSAVMPHILANKVKALAVTPAERWPNLPDLPTVSEAGVTGFEVSSWFGIVAPKDTPDEYVEKFAAAVEKALSDPQVAERMYAIGASPAFLGPRETDAFMREEVARWQPAVEASGAIIE